MVSSASSGERPRLTSTHAAASALRPTPCWQWISARPPACCRSLSQRTAQVSCACATGRVSGVGRCKSAMPSRSSAAASSRSSARRSITWRISSRSSAGASSGRKRPPTASRGVTQSKFKRGTRSVLARPARAQPAKYRATRVSRRASVPSLSTGRSEERMRIDFIGHASLLIRSGDLSLITDPWWVGPAYQAQWFAWPFPVPERYELARLDAIFISHGHEDHLHGPTLQSLSKSATVILPRSYDAGNLTYLGRLGFRRVEEVAGGHSISLQRGGAELRLTVLTYLGDAIVAVEADGQVLLNVNDALHCARDEVIDEYCRVLARRFARIDYLFCGFGGASWFPNCFRRDGKDDVAVAERREQLFLRKFARIAARLAPRHAFPFAAHFVLPDERNWWISELRLRAGPPARALAELTRGAPVEVHDLSPGDFVE